jgi:hypothetical protein
MPSVWNRLTGLFPGFSRGTAPAAPARAEKVLADTTQALAQPKPTRTASAREKVPHQHGAGVSRVTFLPYLDSATKDSVEIRAAMRKMLRSPWVKAAWTSQVFEVARQEHQFQADPDDPDGERNSAFLRHCVDRLPMGLAGLVLSITLPLGPDGVSVSEKVVEPQTRGKWAGKFVPKAVKSKDLETLQLLGDEFRNLTTIRSLRAMPNGPTEWDAREFLVATYLPVFCDPYGTAAFRASYAAYWMLDTVQKLRAIHHEKRTSGTLVGTYTDEDQLSTLEAALAALKSTTWAAVPEGVKIECLALTTAADTDYRAFEQDKQTEIVAGIAGATLHILQGNVTDARGDTQVQQETSELGPWYLTRLVEETVNRQWVPELLDWNFPAVQSYPRLTLGAVTEEERQKKLATLKAALDAGFDNLDKAYYARELSLQTTDDPAKALKVAAGVPPGSPPPGAAPFSPFAEGGAARGAGTFPGQVLTNFAEPPPGPAPLHDQVALPGADGRRAVDLLKRATDEGKAALARVADQAVRRLLADPDWRTATTLFSDDELRAVADALGATVATADLLGRSRVVGMAERAGAKAFAEKFAAPGPPPRPGLVWKEETSRWVRADKGGDDTGPPADDPDALRAERAEVGRRLEAAKAAAAATPDAKERATYHQQIGDLTVARGDLDKRVRAAEKAGGGRPAGEPAPDAPPPHTPHTGTLFDAPPGSFVTPDGKVGVPKQPTRPLAPADEDAARRGVLAAAAANELGGLSFDRLYQAARSGHPGISRPQFRELVDRIDREGLVTMTGWAKSLHELPDKGAAVIRGGKLYYYARPPDAGQRARLAAAGFAEQTARTFADPPDVFAPFADPPPALAPRAAVDYFRRLVPLLGIDPERFGPLLDRHAFTLAHATDQTLLEKVKTSLGLLLEGRAADAGVTAGIPGAAEVPPTGPAVVAKLLDDAGVSPRNSAYSEMVWRVNTLDAYHQGAFAELRRPENQELFPVWEYLGIRDGRQGEDHEPKFGRFYPSTAAFAAVRGPRIFNCRCSFRPVDHTEWAELESRGVRLESSW